MEQLTRDHLVNMRLVELETEEAAHYFFVADADIPMHDLYDAAQRIHLVKVGSEIHLHNDEIDCCYDLLNVNVLELDDPRAEHDLDFYLEEHSGSVKHLIGHRLTNNNLHRPWETHCFFGS